jgi:predicted RNA-binding Zn ribbon-like protein
MSEPVIERPLRGEPLGLDLLNTVWAGRGGPVDLFDPPGGPGGWLAEAGLDDEPTRSADPAAVLGALRTARDAIRSHVDEGGSPAATARLNDVLSWGYLQPQVYGNEVVQRPTVADPARRAAWLAAFSYTELLAAAPDRVRRCAHPDCVLYFYDTSPKRSRRWCSMASCGNRAKAARHYARTSSRGRPSARPADDRALSSSATTATRAATPNAGR